MSESSNTVFTTITIFAESIIGCPELLRRSQDKDSESRKTIAAHEAGITTTENICRRPVAAVQIYLCLNYSLVLQEKD